MTVYHFNVEIWKDIIGYEGYYQISNLGRVKSLERKFYNGKAIHIRKDKILKNAISSKNYYTISLQINKIKKSFLIHRLVAIAFIPNPNNYPCVNHIDGNTLNMSLDNLEWCSYSYNTLHAFRLGLKNTNGIKNSHCKLIEQDVYDIRSINHPNIKEIAKKYKLNITAIYKILKHETWKHI